jgi:hypothetical protein
MSYLLTATLALLNSNALYPGEDHGAFKRAYHYSIQLRGLCTYCVVLKGMTEPEVQAIVGKWNCCTGGIDGGTYQYCQYSLTVQFQFDNGHLPERVIRVQWRPLGFSPGRFDVQWRTWLRRFELEKQTHE